MGCHFNPSHSLRQGQGNFSSAEASTSATLTISGQDRGSCWELRRSPTSGSPLVHILSSLLARGQNARQLPSVSLCCLPLCKFLTQHFDASHPSCSSNHSLNEQLPSNPLVRSGHSATYRSEQLRIRESLPFRSLPSQSSGREAGLHRIQDC